jgi:hypothetical protein
MSTIWSVRFLHKLPLKCIIFEDKLFSFRFQNNLLVIKVKKNSQSKNVTSSIFPDILDK